VIDYATGRSFRQALRALKLWFVIRHYGVEACGTRAPARGSGQEFARWCRPSRASNWRGAAAEPRVLPATRGDDLNQALMDRLNQSGDIYLTNTRCRSACGCGCAWASPHRAAPCGTRLQRIREKRLFGPRIAAHEKGNSMAESTETYGWNRPTYVPAGQAQGGPEAGAALKHDSLKNNDPPDHVGVLQLTVPVRWKAARIHPSKKPRRSQRRHASDHPGPDQVRAIVLEPRRSNSAYFRFWRLSAATGLAREIAAWIKANVDFGQ